jgi:hypothetical protein
MKNAKPAFEEYSSAHAERAAVRKDLVVGGVWSEDLEKVEILFPKHAGLSVYTADRFERWFRERILQAMTDVLTAVDAREERAFAALQEAIAKDAAERDER